MTGKLEIVAPRSRESLDQLSDDELMVLVAGDHRAPFEELVKRHHKVVLGYATRFVGDRSLAREITQEVFLTTWQERRAYAPRGKLRSYLLSVAFNRCQAATRRRKTAAAKQTQVKASAAAQADPAEPLDQLLEAEKAARVRQELLRLDDRTRQAIVLRFCSELSYDEISEVTGQRTGTLKSRVSRGIKALLGRLPQEYRA